MKDISVIIPCFNEIKTIAKVIVSARRELDAVDIDYELIVVDNGSFDGSDSVAKNNGAFVLYSGSKTVAGVRNEGVNLSVGRVLIFLDADIEVERGWGSGIQDVYRDILNNDNAIYGSHPNVPGNLNPILFCWYQSISRDVRNTHLGTGHMIVSRKGFDIIGRFDTSLSSGEDFDFCTRAKNNNINIVSLPKLIVFHHGYPRTFYDFLKREVWHGIGDCGNLTKFFHSRVAVTGSLFFLLNFFFIVFLFISLSISLYIFILITAIAFATNLYKFGAGDIKSVLYRSIVAYFYLMGRGVSFFLALMKISPFKIKNIKKFFK